jgi:hypothetical protein
MRVFQVVASIGGKCAVPVAGSDALEESKSTQENRAACEERILAREMHGYLAFLDDQAIGWCHAAPRHSVTCTPPCGDVPLDAVGARYCESDARNP